MVPGDTGIYLRFEEGQDKGRSVTLTAGGVYVIGRDQELTAAYYRNCVVHFFVAGAIVELALLQAARPEAVDPTGEFWEEAMRLRDLLKFEFFFPEKDVFREELRRELSLHDTTTCSFAKSLDDGPEAIVQYLQQIRPLNAHRILRPFLEAYRVLADQLQRCSPDADPADRVTPSQATQAPGRIPRRLLTEAPRTASAYWFGTAWIVLKASPSVNDPGF